MVEISTALNNLHRLVYYGSKGCGPYKHIRKSWVKLENAIDASIELKNKSLSNELTNRQGSTTEEIKQTKL